MSRRRRGNGFTLVELMAYLGGVSILLGAAASITLQSERDRRLATALGDDTMALRRAADAIERDLRGAASVVVGPTGVEADRVTWRLDRGELLRGGQHMAARVAAFETSRTADGCVRVRIELQPRTAGATRRASITTVVEPRIDGTVR